MYEINTKVVILSVPSSMYDGFIGKEAKASAKVGNVSGHQQFLVDGTKALYLSHEMVKPL